MSEKKNKILPCQLFADLAEQQRREKKTMGEITLEGARAKVLWIQGSAKDKKERIDNAVQK